MNTSGMKVGVVKMLTFFVKKKNTWRSLLFKDLEIKKILQNSLYVNKNRRCIVITKKYNLITKTKYLITVY